MPPDTARRDIVGADPVLASPFPLGEIAATAMAAAGRAAATLWELRTGEAQDVRVDVGAAAASLLGFAFQKLDGVTPMRTAEGNPLVALYECRDGRWIHLHGSFPGLAAATRKVIGEGDDVAALVRRWDAQDLEDALAAEGTCGAMVRTAEEWKAHPQAQAVDALARIAVTKIGDAEPEPVGDGIRPLGGVRALDLTRVLAGPTCGRTLAAHGADVLLLNKAGMPNVPAFVLDTSHGKRSAHLDLDTEADVLRDLVRGADVFTNGYRGGALDKRGFSAEDVAALRPGIVYVSISCYGDVGPWRTRPGWEQLAQSVSGMAHTQGQSPSGSGSGKHDGPPRLVPAAACDYTTGHLAAAGAMMALALRATDGGSYHVQVSLCQTAAWVIAEKARCDPAQASGLPDLSPWMTTSVTPEGTLEHLGPIVEMSATPPRWDRPSPPLGFDQPTWI